MMKKIKWFKILSIAIWVICLTGLVTLMSFIEKEKSTNKCNKVEIYLPGNQYFVERKELNDILNDHSDSLIGKNLNLLNIQKIENRLKKNPFILSAKVYADMDGILHADVNQRIPLLRIINAIGQDFYVDNLGNKIPLSAHYTARVLVANGSINEGFNGKIDTLNTKIGRSIYHVASFINNHSIWKDQIEQIYISPNNIIELVPKIGEHRIILGDASNLVEKFRNLLILYKKAFPKYGWQTYQSINLSYKGQVVCEKRDSLSIQNHTVKDSLKKNQPIEIIIKDTVKKTL